MEFRSFTIVVRDRYLDPTRTGSRMDTRKSVVSVRPMLYVRFKAIGIVGIAYKIRSFKLLSNSPMCQEFGFQTKTLIILLLNPIHYSFPFYASPSALGGNGAGDAIAIRCRVSSLCRRLLAAAQEQAHCEQRA